MPALAVALPWIIAGTGLASAGVSAYQMNDNRINQDAASSQNAAALKADQQSQANQQALTDANALKAHLGQAQAQTGGSLTDNGFQDFAAQLAGLPGYTASTAGRANTSQPTSGGAPDIQSLLAQLQGGNISGGGSAQPQVPQSQMELSNPVV